MLNFLSQPSHETPTPAEGGTEEKRDAIVRHLIEREGFNAYRFADRLAGMPFDAYWQFSEEEAKQLPPVIPYNPAQRLYIEQLWSKQFPDSGFSTLDLAVQAIAIDLHEHGARPALAVRGPVCVIPRDVLGVPILALAVPLS